MDSFPDPISPIVRLECGRYIYIECIDSSGVVVLNRVKRRRIYIFPIRFSQEKYLRKKQKKYLREVTLLPLNLFNYCHYAPGAANGPR